MGAQPASHLVQHHSRLRLFGRLLPHDFNQDTLQKQNKGGIVSENKGEEIHAICNRWPCTAAGTRDDGVLRLAHVVMVYCGWHTW